MRAICVPITAHQLISNLARSYRMPKYIETEDCIILELDDKTLSIPKNPSNSDYQEYLASLEETDSE